MNLEEAISHLENLIDNHDFECLECKRDHEDLLGFLVELKQRRDENGRKRYIDANALQAQLERKKAGIANQRYTQRLGRNASRTTSVPTVNERTGQMQKGDTIRARFMTLPDLFPGKGCEEKKFPIRKGTVVYVHPKGRYIVAECKGVRETFFPEEVLI